MKPYPKYKDSGVEWIGNVPEGWGINKIKHSTYVKGRIGWHGLNSNDFINEGPFLITGTDFSNGRIDWNTCYHVSVEHYDKDPFIQLKENDLLITKDGSIGKIAIVQGLEGQATLNSGIFVTRPSKNQYLTAYLYWVLNSLVFVSFIDYNKTGSTVLHLYQDTFENFSFPLPSMEEQKAICYYLDRKTTQIDNLISKKQKLIELLKEERAAIINQAVTKGLNPDAPMKNSGIEWLGEVPAHWEVKRLKWLIKGKLKYGANEATELTDESLPRYIRITDFDDNGTLRIETFKSLPFEIAKDYLLHDGDILFARSGATVGKTFLYQNYKGIACYAGYLIKASVNSKLILSNFLYYYTKSNTYENWKDSVFIQATIQNIGADKYQMLNVPRPPMNEQVRIVKHIDKETTKIDQVTSKIEKQINLLKEFRNALISEVVTGKIDVRT